MATQERDVPTPAGSIAPTLDLEGGGLGEPQEVEARGYWDNVWRRFKRDKVAIAGGIFIIFLFIAAFAGAPIAAHILGHGPDDQYAQGVR